MHRHISTSGRMEANEKLKGQYVQSSPGLPGQSESPSLEQSNATDQRDNTLPPVTHMVPPLPDVTRTTSTHSTESTHVPDAPHVPDVRNAPDVRSVPDASDVRIVPDSPDVRNVPDVMQAADGMAACDVRSASGVREWDGRLHAEHMGDPGMAAHSTCELNSSSALPCTIIPLFLIFLLRLFCSSVDFLLFIRLNQWRTQEKISGGGVPRLGVRSRRGSGGRSPPGRRRIFENLQKNFLRKLQKNALF